MLGKFLLLNLILSTNGLRKAGFKLVIFWQKRLSFGSNKRA
ncbi:hypothetical protein BVRB_9g211430 isoform C [Beta vulgaris subsp. vulgaris]|nr:hypothetical protein BVRB_9g211430 isoform C [Beta vulgaris subsp. vulgaris]